MMISKNLEDAIEEEIASRVAEELEDSEKVWAVSEAYVQTLLGDLDVDVDFPYGERKTFTLRIGDQERGVVERTLDLEDLILSRADGWDDSAISLAVERLEAISKLLRNILDGK